MDCWYCHNKHLWKSENLIGLSEIYGFLESHKDFLDGVVISGGEPTLQKGLEGFIRTARGMGYLLKLDTNGTNPGILKKLMPLLDYVAMDLKAPPGGLGRVVSYAMDETPIWESADMLIESGGSCEFRTTFMPLLSIEDIEMIAQRIAGAKRYALQQYRKTKTVKLAPEPHSRQDLTKAAQAAQKYVGEVIVRGI